MHFRLPSMRDFSRDARMLIIASGLFAVSFFGVQTLLKVLYVIRLGYGPVYVGLFTSMGAITYMSMGLPSGALGSRFGVRRIMIIGGIISVVGMASLPLTEFVPVALRNFWPNFSQVLTTMGWSMLNVNLIPTLMANTTEWNRNSAYALNSAFRETGTLAGTLVGGLLPGLFANVIGQTLGDPAPYRYALWVGAGLGLVAVTPLTFVKRVKSTAVKTRIKPSGSAPIIPILTMGIYVYVRHAGWATCKGFCNAYMDTDLHLTASSIGLIGSVAQIGAIIATLITPRLLSLYSNGRVLFVTTIGVSLSLLPMAFIPNWVAAGLGRIIYQIVSAIWIPTLQVFQMELVDSEWRALTYGATAMVMGFGFGSMSLAGGYIIAARGYGSFFFIGACFELLSAAILWWILKKRPHHSAKAT